MRRIHGPYRHHDRWRIKIVERSTGAVTHQTFPTEEEAEAAMRALRRQLGRESGVSVGDALDAYDKHLAQKGNRPRAIATTTYRLRRFFQSVVNIAVVGLTPAAGQKLYDTFAQAPTQHGQPMSVDSCRNALAEAKTFLSWARSKGWASTNALDEVQGIGKRRRGKPQLTVDEARRWLKVAAEMAGQGDEGAVGATMALLMGMRASEIADRIVRNLDDEGRLLWITDAKTQAGVRRLQVPEQLQPHLQRLATGKQPGDRLFGRNASRFSVRSHVRRICKAAGVPIVPPHGLRGTHASLAMSAGATGDLVAAALGHESFTTTARHYARPEAIADAQQSGALRELEKSSRGFPRAA